MSPPTRPPAPTPIFFFSESQYDPTHKLETPCNVELKNTTRYQVRAYGIGAGQQSFSTAKVTAADWASATNQGFGANFAYITGANTQKKKIPMTAPVLTRNVGSSGNEWLVSFFTPQSIYPDTSTTPQPTAANMYIDVLPLTTFAVLEFPGEANGVSYALQKDKLVAALQADNIRTRGTTRRMRVPPRAACSRACAPPSHPHPLGTPAPRTRAQDLFNRHNEVWIQILI